MGIQATEHRSTHSRKLKAHDTNRLWAQVEIEPNSHISSTHSYKNGVDISFLKKKSGN